MTGLRLFAWLTAATMMVAGGGLTGCGDNADELAQARAAKKPPPAKTATPADGTIPVSNSNTSLPAPGGPTTDVGGVCQPEAVTTLDALWRPPHAPHMKACSQQEANVLAMCFFENQGCEQQVSAVCHQCAVSSAVASTTYGAIIVDETGGKDAEPNVEGCVAIATGDVSANGCGARLRSKFGCDSQACDKCDDANFDACVRTASTSACASYTQAAASCMSALPQCIKGTTKSAIALNLIQLFCM